MQYMILIYGDESKMPSVPSDKTYEMSQAYAAYNAALKKAGVFLAGDRLKPTRTATTIKIRDGKTDIIDGPFAEAKEQLGGYYLIETPDLDAALDWAKKCPGSTLGTVELRPVWLESRV